MSVLQCDRTQCPNIMCDRLILHSTAYICEDCYSELKQSMNEWPESMPRVEVEERIRSFMQSPKGSRVLLHRREIMDEFNALTGDCDREQEEHDK